MGYETEFWKAVGTGIKRAVTQSDRGLCVGILGFDFKSADDLDEEDVESAVRLLEQAEDWQRGIRATEQQQPEVTTAGAGSSTRQLPIESTEKEEVAAKCVSKSLVNCLNGLADVRDFRGRLPNGRMLSGNGVRFFQNSPLTVLFSFDELNKLGLESTDWDFKFRPIPDRWRYRYTVACMSPTIQGYVERVSVERDPGDLLRIKWGPVTLGTGNVEGAITIGDADGGTGLGRRFTGPPRGSWDDPWHRSRRLFNCPYHPSFKNEWFNAHNVHCIDDFGLRGTVMGQALQIASDISTNFHVMVHEALDFLLYGREPSIRPATARTVARPVMGKDGQFRYSATVSVLIEAHPWASIEGAVEQVRELQQLQNEPLLIAPENAGDSERKPGEKRRIRLPDVNTMRIYLFVEERESGSTRRSWRSLAKQFSDEHQTNISPETFKKKFHRGRAAIEQTLLPRNEFVTRHVVYSENKATTAGS